MLNDSLTDQQLQTFRQAGHVTVSGVFSPTVMQAALVDLQQWSHEFLSRLGPDEQAWYLEGEAEDWDASRSPDSVPKPLGKPSAKPLRKLDQPVAEREVFARLASHSSLVAMVEQLIGGGVTVCFSQVFMKPPQVGGPKPVHQDNFYFGPSDPDGIVTAWIALDAATVENGCLFYGEGSHRRGVLPHIAPPDQPFNLQIPSDQLQCEMTPAPVPQGGVSFHHGNTFHQSSENSSSQWRRAAALHYLRNDVKLVAPALDYDAASMRRITEANR